jgi:hypothetical protein
MRNSNAIIGLLPSIGKANKRFILPFFFYASLLLTISTKTLLAQTPVSGFENWTGLTTSNYDTVFQSYYGLPNAMHGQPDGWNAYYGSYTPNSPLIPSINLYGVVKADGQQAASGTAAIVLHTWYFYGRSTITWEDTITSAPLSVKGLYKRITEITANDTLHNGFSKGYSFLLSAANDTLYRGEITFTDTSVWTPFEMNLQPYNLTSSPIDRIFIAFVNDSNVRNCVEQGICDLLWLDDIELNMGATSVTILNNKASGFLPTPNPATEMVQVRPFEDAETASYVITDLSCRVILEGQLGAGESTVSLTNIPNGIYQIRLKTANSIVNHRLLKQ